MNIFSFSIVLCMIMMFHDVSPDDATIIMKVPVDTEPVPATLVATRSTREVDHVRVLPAHAEHGGVAIYRTIEDAVEISLKISGSPRAVLWTKTKQADRSLDMEHMMERLVLYDMLYDDAGAWVLYSKDSRVFLDRVTADEHGSYRVDRTIAVVTLLRASLRPYVIETGKIVREDDSIMVAAHLRTYKAHDRRHPYVFWQIENHSATEIDDPETITALREALEDHLERDRPRMSLQMTSP